MSDTTLMYLVRHGATPANEARPHVLQGRGVDHSLSETGRRQAEAVARAFEGIAFSALYSSGLRRTIETARAIGGSRGLEPTLVERLHEIDVGRWEGWNWGRIQRDEPEAYADFRERGIGYPEGESYADVLARVKPELMGLLERHPGEAIVVVAHNVVNRVFLADLLGLPVSVAHTIRQTNTGVNVIKRKDGETYAVTINAALHIAAAGLES